ncbi:HNH endonuclease signature motif containing protein [Streptomyces sp. TRM76323]|uniref:HNH endonuclease signature motif containing protein n=1 Tax=Streptomyces tamarix TaxID=3078565 RepID=A0ABU3QL90_9ACTN|nr:HNH endonuclease signature motif containing protein [Streptomyces tamarix]MDT9683396.1 HNH endonuclease signature motif containing protein [Streptomyces tamarix]
MIKIDLFTDKEFKDIVNSSTSISDALQKIGYSHNSYSASKKLKERMNSLSISIDNSHRYDYLKIPDSEVYCNNSNSKGFSIAERVRKDNFMNYSCAVCGNKGIWMGKEITLQLHHIDGNFRNNEKSNLSWLCPNCHTQTSNYGSKNSFRSKNPRSKFKDMKCIMCGNYFTPKYRGQIYCSNRCVSKSQKRIPPVDKDTLYNLLINHSFIYVGRQYNVSDNAVRKWCIKYDIPSNSKYYRDL